MPPSAAAPQPTLFDIIEPEYEREMSIAERFDVFHRANPRVYVELRRMARRLKDIGRKHYGIKGLFEVLRWRHAVSTMGDAWKLNNNYTAHYARLLMENEPELRGMFATRGDA